MENNLQLSSIIRACTAFTDGIANIIADFGILHKLTWCEIPSSLIKQKYERTHHPKRFPAKTVFGINASPDKRKLKKKIQLFAEKVAHSAGYDKVFEFSVIYPLRWLRKDALYFDDWDFQEPFYYCKDFGFCGDFHGIENIYV